MDQHTPIDEAAIVPPQDAFAEARGPKDVDYLPQCGTAPIRIGGEEHKTVFCRMLLDSFRPYRPVDIAWPALTYEARQRLCGLPIWDIAVETEKKPSHNVRSYARTVADPLLRRAIELNGFEEARHKELLTTLLSAYAIASGQQHLLPEPRDAEWAFMVTGYSECIDSFF